MHTLDELRMKQALPLSMLMRLSINFGAMVWPSPASFISSKVRPMSSSAESWNGCWEVVDGVYLRLRSFLS